VRVADAVHERRQERCRTPEWAARRVEHREVLHTNRQDSRLAQPKAARRARAMDGPSASRPSGDNQLALVLLS